MAYNLQPLITILQQILDPEQIHYYFRYNKPQFQSLLEKVVHVQQILEKSSLPKMGSLESQIRDAANKVEDIIESHIVDLMLSMEEWKSFFVLTLDVQQASQELDSVMEQVVNLVEVEGKKMSIGSPLIRDASVLSSKSIVVGVDADLLQLKDRLTGMTSKLDIIPIIGMGGIGKTTLARKLYEDPLIVSHFMFCAWTTISQDYNVRAILLSVLGYIIGKDETDKHIEKGNDELKDILYQSLYGRRYIIVLDDIWSNKFWDEMRRYFPDNNNGSRIVITTRESDVARYAGLRSDLHHQVQFLNESDSWNLLRQILFGEDDCPYELQGIGKRIASDCGGLPLAINVIGGLLSKLERSGDVWEKIGNNVRVAIVESDEKFSSILSLSYNHLPDHLKPCFLYVGAFPEDYEIKGSRLIRMWIAEGFVKSNGDKSLEEEANDYLKALVERNLLLVRQYKYGKPNRYNMHDLLRDLCIKKAGEERFLHVKNGPEVTFSNPRRVSVHASHGMLDVYASAESISVTRSFICIGQMLHGIPLPAFFVLRLLRVLDLMEVFRREFPTEIYQLVNLRYLAIECYTLPVGISRLRNLQTLIVDLRRIDMPSEISWLSELRHLKVKGVMLFENENKKHIEFPLKKLQVISSVYLTESLIKSGLFRKFPNIKKMVLYYCDVLISTAVDLSRLHKLEILTCQSEGRYSPFQYGSSRFQYESALFRYGVIFPSSLRKLSLFKGLIPAGVLTALCAIPNLEVLKLNGCNFERDEWKVAEGDEFHSLQFLHIGSSKLVHWEADETNFSRLNHLRLSYCHRLVEIPSGIGDITTLQLIELEHCSATANDSARRIQEAQQSDYDNYDLKLRIR